MARVLTNAEFAALDSVAVKESNAAVVSTTQRSDSVPVNGTYVLMYPDNPRDCYHEGKVMVDEIEMPIINGIVTTTMPNMRDALISMGYVYLFERRNND